MACPVNRWPIHPSCPKCDNAVDENLLITELAVERDGYLIVTLYCGECRVAYNVPYFFPQLLVDANDEDKKIAKNVLDVSGTWRVCTNTKPN